MQGRSVSDLIDDGVLHEGFRRMATTAFPIERPLHVHQEQAISRAVGHRRNLIVATGTGSGKTECFLLPIINRLLQEGSAKHSRTGVRALLLYPMNALANEQVKRLRRLLADYPEITFGRYVGETETSLTKAESAFAARYPAEPRLENELIARSRCRSNRRTSC